MTITARETRRAAMANLVIDLPQDALLTIAKLEREVAQYKEEVRLATDVINDLVAHRYGCECAACRWLRGEHLRV